MRRFQSNKRNIMLFCHGVQNTAHGNSNGIPFPRNYGNVLFSGCIHRIGDKFLFRCIRRSFPGGTYAGLNHCMMITTKETQLAILLSNKTARLTDGQKSDRFEVTNYLEHSLNKLAIIRMLLVFHSMHSRESGP